MSKVYNVLESVVALVRADSPDDAARQLRDSLSRAGFEVYSAVTDAFESDDQSAYVDPLPGAVS